MLSTRRSWIAFLVGFLFSAAIAPAREFVVMAYNVEMLFDVDGVSLLEEYRSPAWGPRQLDRKLAGISQVLQRTNQGRGPDIICFSEFEADQTPQSTVSDLSVFLRKWSGRTTSELLAADSLPPELAGAPVQAWLAKRLVDDGLAPYQVRVGAWRSDPTGHLVFHTNAVFSRFPILAARTHPTEGARGILEVEVEIDGHRLFVFANHWKSGASDPSTEPIRIGNARVLRRRLDEILRADPQADVILAGDFNSYYNQKPRFPELERTALNDVLGSQGDELAAARAQADELYNLWFELPVEKRGSDVYRGEWGTLMHLILTPGLYDFHGVQYVDNSFAVGAFPGLNADAAGRPVRWHFADGGGGFADHFPVAAIFRTVDENLRDRRLPLRNPSRTREGPSAPLLVRLPLDQATALSAWPDNTEFRTAANLGRLFRVKARVTNQRPFRVRVDGPDVEIVLWIDDPTRRAEFFARHRVGERIEFVGELGQYRGEWQLVIPPPASR